MKWCIIIVTAPLSKEPDQNPIITRKMAKDILTAKVAVVRFGAIEIEGLLFEDGRYGVALQQAAALFSVPQNNAQRNFKALLGEDFQFLKIRAQRAVRQNRTENALILLDFEKLTRKLDKQGNSAAETMADALVGLSLTQVFSDSFGIEFGKKERESYLASRITEKPDKARAKHFSPDWQKEASRVTGYHWQGMPMANFIRRAIYGPLGVDVSLKLNAVNPYIEGSPRRENLHYQHFDVEVDEVVLKAHILEVLTLLKIARSERQFWKLMQDRFGSAIQL